MGVTPEGYRKMHFLRGASDVELGDVPEVRGQQLPLFRVHVSYEGTALLARSPHRAEAEGQHVGPRADHESALLRVEREVRQVRVAVYVDHSGARPEQIVALLSQHTSVVDADRGFGELVTSAIVGHDKRSPDALLLHRQSVLAADPGRPNLFSPIEEKPVVVPKEPVVDAETRDAFLLVVVHQLVQGQIEEDQDVGPACLYWHGHLDIHVLFTQQPVQQAGHILRVDPAMRFPLHKRQPQRRYPR
mmetsp:Transcript_83419/g.193895  ORF Transcript_83419/g.193895 Transcript_83419/m.193895 type:complete len:246 (-) Transcript_83419:64-801(-)